MSHLLFILVCALLLLPAFGSSSAQSGAQSRDHSVKSDKLNLAADFSQGMTRDGVPAGWILKNITGKTRFSIITEGNAHALKVESSASAAGLLKRMEIDPKRYQIIAWRWKIERAIAQADEREKDGDDCAARVFVIFKDSLPGASAFSRLKHKLESAFSGGLIPGVAICYVWASKLAKDEIIKSPYTDWVRLVAVESGGSRAGRWLSEERNVFEDFKKMFGREPKQILGVAIMTDTDNTKQRATACYADIVFKAAADK